MAKPGDYLTNGNYTKVWTCPECMHEPDHRVTECASCSTPLRCTIEMQPVPVCTIPELEEEDDEDEYDEQEIPLDTPSLDTSFHDHEMDVG